MPPDPHIPLSYICSRELGLTHSEVMGIATTGPRRYKTYAIPKRNGDARIICQPARELKALQYVFLRKFLVDAPLHSAGTAYRKGASILENALPHRHSRVLLKLDFRDFFHSITVEHWSIYAHNMYNSWTEDDLSFSSMVLFWGRGGYAPKCLSIGAPTSPILSNMLMYDLDEKIFKYCGQNHLTYTRYADDITISSDSYIMIEDVINSIKAAIRDSLLSNLKLNDEKTILASKSRARRVTGLVLTNDGRVSLGRDRKRLISAMIDRARKGALPIAEMAELRGLLAFSYGVEPNFVENLEKKYGKVFIRALLFKSII